MKPGLRKTFGIVKGFPCRSNQMALYYIYSLHNRASQ